MSDTTLPVVLDRIRESVNQNDLRDALDQLIALLKGTDADLYNEAIAQSGRLTGLLRQERQGVLTTAEFEAWQAKLRLALLGLLDEIPAKLGARALPFATAPVRFNAPEETTLEKIFGANHLKSIAWLRRGIEAAAAVCRVMTPDGRGSGFLLSGGRVVTNHHVLPSADVARESRVELNYEEDFAGKIVPSTDYALKPDTFRTDAALDVTVVAIEPGSSRVPLEAWGHLELSTGPEPKVGDHVTIIQHPLGGPKQVAITANQVVNVWEHRLHYTTDTQPGSSGSPVFNDHWKVIALHHAGGNVIANSRGDRMFANEGILAPYILKAIGS